MQDASSSSSTSSFIAPGTFRIRQADQAAALQNLQRGCPKHMVVADYLKNPEEFARTRYLARAFELLGMQCDVDGGDLLLVPFAGGDPDLSAYYWDFIEDLAHEEAPGTMAHGTRVAFHEAGIDVEEDDDGSDGDDEDHQPASEAVDEFIGEMRDRKITLAELNALIASEGRANFRDYNGTTPLLAASEGYGRALSQHADAQMESGDSDEETREAMADAAAELEVQTHNLHTVLQSQPDMAARNRDGADALGIAAESGSMEFVDLLLAHGATVNAGALLGAVRSLSVDMVRKLSHGNTHLVGPDLLIHACAAHSAVPTKLDVVRTLVEDLGCNANARATNSLHEGLGTIARQATPLMAAALTDDMAVAQYLLAAEADVHAVDAYGNTALHYCSGQTWVSEDGPLWFALDDNAKVMALLRQHGADDGASNVAGRTPGDLFADRRG